MTSSKPTILSRLSIGLLAAVLAAVFYVLSVGPAVALVHRRRISPETYEMAYYPVLWIYENNRTFHDALDWYAEFWIPEGWDGPK